MSEEKPFHDEPEKTTPANDARSRMLRLLASYVLGLVVGLVFHYALYRMSMPATPFIYQSF